MSTASSAPTLSADSLFAPVERPWGSYTTLDENDGYKVKCIRVKPGASLSLQLHHSRSEHWVVVRGEAVIQIGDQRIKAGPGEHRFIPCGEKHRLTNRGSDDLVLIEVQRGTYLGEDDIVRFEDVYGRVQQS